MISGQICTLVWVPSLKFKSWRDSKVLYLQKAMPKFYSTLGYKILFFIKSQLEHHICNNATFMSRFPHCALFYVRFDFHLRPIHVLLSILYSTWLYFDFILILSKFDLEKNLDLNLDKVSFLKNILEKKIREKLFFETSG